MQQFMGNITASCRRVDYLGVHWYGVASFHNFRSKMLELNNMYEQPLVITELAVADYSADETNANLFSQPNCWRS